MNPPKLNLLTAVRRVMDGMELTDTAAPDEVTPGATVAGQVPSAGIQPGFLALARPGARTGLPRLPVTLEDLSGELIYHVGWHLKPGSEKLKALSGATHKIRASLEHPIAADKLCSEAKKLGASTNGNRVDQLSRVVKAAELVHPALRPKILRSVLDAILVSVLRQNVDIAQPLSDVVEAAKLLNDLSERHNVGQAVSAVLNHVNFYAHVAAPESPFRDRARLEAIYAEHTDAQIALVQSHVSNLGRHLTLQGSTPLEVQHATATVRAKILGGLASSLYLVRNETQRMVQWKRFFIDPCCAEPEGRFHLLEGLADAAHNMDSPAMRSEVLYKLLPEVAKLPQHDQAHMLEQLGLLIVTLDTEAQQIHAFDALRSVAGAAPVAVRVDCSKAIIELLEIHPLNETQSAFTSLLASAVREPDVMRAPLLASLAYAIKHLPPEARDAAFQKIYAAVTGLSPEFGTEPAAELATALQELSHHNDVAYQLRFADMIGYATIVPPAKRQLLVENMVKQLARQPHRTVGCLDYRDVLELVAQQPDVEQFALLPKCYEIIWFLDLDWSSKLLDATDRVVGRLPAVLQAELAKDAAGVAMSLNPPFLFAQFQRMIERSRALPEPHAAKALLSIGDALNELLTKLDPEDFFSAEEQGPALPEAFDTVLRLAEILPHPVRVRVLEGLANSCTNIPAQLQSDARIAILNRGDGLSLSELNRIYALLNFAEIPPDQQ